MYNLVEPVLMFRCDEFSNPISTNGKHIVQITYDTNGELKVLTNMRYWYYEKCATTYFFESLMKHPNYYHKLIKLLEKLKSQSIEKRIVINERGYSE